MALAGNTWAQLLNQIASDLSRTDLVSTPTPLATDLAWVYGITTIQRYQPRIFMPGQAYVQWCSTVPNQNLYALPVDFEEDGQIIQNQYGQNFPLEKRSEYFINQVDIQKQTPILGQAQFYCIYGTAANMFQNLPTWQAGFDYSNVGQFYQLLDANGNVQIASAVYGDGISGGTTPTWATTLGATTVDGNTTNGMQWTCSYVLSQAVGPVLRIWPWPSQAYQMTAVYQNILPAPTSATTSNFWTTTAEAMIRFDTEGLLRKEVFKEDAGSYQADFDSGLKEFNWISSLVRKQSATGRARPVYL
jgi:hypothetical protein